MKPHYILRPVKPLFIGFTLTLAFFLNLMPWGQWWGIPDFLALVLIFWNIHEPRKINIGTAFFMGLFMDVHNAHLLGQNALAYTLQSFFAIMIHRRVLWFSPPMQALHILPLLMFSQTVQLAVRMITGDNFPSLLYFSASFSGAALWSCLGWLLLAPQRRPVDPDENRPL